MYRRRSYSRKRRAPARRSRSVKRPRLSGLGDYKLSDTKSLASLAKGKNILPIAGGLVGAGLGSFFPGIGNWVGAGVGMAAGKLISHITGLGDYQVHRNTLMAAGNDPPLVRNTGLKSVIISHREMIEDVSGSTAFTLERFAINPGRPETFPWLSQLAANFEEWVPRGIIFYFKSTSADALNSTNTALGTVIMATNYNAGSESFESKQEMMNYQFSTTVKPSDSGLHPIECDPRYNTQKAFFVRVGSVPSGEDVRLYDLGAFQLATQGMQAAATIGELWVSYEIELRKPKMSAILGDAILTDHYQLTGITNAIPFGTGTEPVAGSSMQTTKVDGTITFPDFMVGRKVMYLHHIVGNSTAISQGNFNLSGCSTVLAFNDNANSFISNTGSTSTHFIRVGVIEIDSEGATLEAAAGTYPASATSGDLWLQQINEEPISGAD